MERKNWKIFSPNGRNPYFKSFSWVFLLFLLLEVFLFSREITYFHYRFTSLKPQKIGSYNQLRVEIIPYFTLKDFTIKVSFTGKNLFFNPLLTRKTIPVVKKGEKIKVFFPYRIMEGADFYLTCKVTFAFKTSSKKAKVLQRNFYVLFPPYESGKNNNSYQFRTILYRGKFLLFLPPFFIENSKIKILNWDKTVSLVNSYRKRLSTFIIKRVDFLKKGYLSYLRSLYSQFFYLLLEKKYRKAYEIIEQLKAEPTSEFKFLSCEDRFAFRCNEAVIISILWPERGLKLLEQLRKEAFFPPYSIFRKYLLFNLSQIYRWKGKNSYARLLLQKALRIDDSFLLAKKFLKKFE